MLISYDYSVIRNLRLLIFFISIPFYADAVDVGNFSHQAYVWQRSWDVRLKTSIEANASLLDGLTVLIAEISPSEDGGSVVYIPVDFDALRATQKPITFAIRIGGYSGSFDTDQPMTRRLMSEVQSVLEVCSINEFNPAAIEIDFDCATSRLEGYTKWLKELRSVLGDVPLSITTLPTWMNRPKAFKHLVQSTDHFVLQVHSIKRPDTISSQVTLCDPADARRWVTEAGSFGVLFHVALPTYGYRIGFDSSGKLVEVCGENASLIKNPNLRYRVIRAKPVLMSQLVREFHQKRPERCRGIIWYRLPIEKEQFNWDSLTWRTVIAGKVEVSDWHLQSVKQADGSIEIQIKQKSAIAQKPPDQIVVEWNGATAIAWDGQRNYDVNAVTQNSLIWQWPKTMTAPLLPQDTHWTIGWVRMDQIAEIKLTISSKPKIL